MAKLRVSDQGSITFGLCLVLGKDRYTGITTVGMPEIFIQKNASTQQYWSFVVVRTTYAPPSPRTEDVERRRAREQLT